MQPLFPCLGFAVKVHFDDIGAGHAVLELDRRAQRHQIAVIDDGDAVAELVGFFHVVRGEQHGEVARGFELVQHLPHGDARDGIEAGGGLVEKKDVRIVHQAARDLKPPPHAAGKRFGLRVAPLDEVDGLEHFLDVLLALGARNAVELGVDDQILFEGQILIAGERLGNDADHAPHVVGILAHVVAGDDGLA